MREMTIKIDRWFFDDLDPANVTKMSSAIDPIRKIVAWCYPNTRAGKTILIYNWQVQKWTYADTTADYIASAGTASVTLEGLGRPKMENQKWKTV